MEHFASIVKAFTESPTPAMLVLVVIALGWTVRAYVQREREQRAELAAMHAAHVAYIQQSNEAHLRTAMLIAPLAEKLVDCVGMVGRIVDRRPAGGAS